MTPSAALGAALRDLYRQSWRLFLLNAGLCACVVPPVVLGLWVPLAWGLLLLAGPLVAALMHCAIVVARTEELRLRDAVTGLRLHWRRGLALGAVLAVGVAAGVQAVAFYAGHGALVLAVVGIYLLILFAAFQLLVWPLAIFEFGRPLRRVLGEAARRALMRPVQTGLLTLALVLVNVAGIAAAVMPFLTLTISYSFLAAAHFALPSRNEPEASV